MKYFIEGIDQKRYMIHVNAEGAAGCWRVLIKLGVDDQSFERESKVEISAATSIKFVVSGLYLIVSLC